MLDNSPSYEHRLGGRMCFRNPCLILNLSEAVKKRPQVDFFSDGRHVGFHQYGSFDELVAALRSHFCQPLGGLE
jgi:hypothetical protein